MTNTSFSALKRSSKTNFQNLVKEIDKLAQSGGSGREEDSRFWKVTRDKTGVGSAIIRFLPAPVGEDLPFIKVFNHAFQGPGGWYIEECPTTVNKDCPCCKANSDLWNDKTEESQAIARTRKRKLSFIGNIYVISDPANTDNEGKVFLFKYGKKIFDKLNDLMHPQFEDEAPVNPFDLWSGCNFRLKIQNVDGWPSYEKSKFDSSKPLFDDDAELENIWNSEHALPPFHDASRFKSESELKSRLDKVLGLGLDLSTHKTAEEAVTAEAKPAKTRKAKEAPKEEAEEAPFDTDENDDSDLSFFKKLAEDSD